MQVPRELGGTLRELQQALGSLRGPLGTFGELVEACNEALRQCQLNYADRLQLTLGLVELRFCS